MMGRFLSPDWSAKIVPVPYAKLDNPQSLNLYAYLRNNPLGGTDPMDIAIGVKGHGIRSSTEKPRQIRRGLSLV